MGFGLKNCLHQNNFWKLVIRRFHKSNKLEQLSTGKNNWDVENDRNKLEKMISFIIGFNEISTKYPKHRNVMIWSGLTAQ